MHISNSLPIFVLSITNNQIKSNQMTTLELYNEMINELGDFIPQNLGMEMMKALINNDSDRLGELSIDIELFGIEVLEDEDEDCEVIGEVAKVELFDLSAINTEGFQSELKKAKKYIAHCEANPVKKTTEKVTVGYDEYNFNDVSIYSINVKRRNKKLTYSQSLVWLSNFICTATKEEVISIIRNEDNENHDTLYNYMKRNKIALSFLEKGETLNYFLS